MTLFLAVQVSKLSNLSKNWISWTHLDNHFSKFFHSWTHLDSRAWSEYFSSFFSYAVCFKMNQNYCQIFRFLVNILEVMHSVHFSDLQLASEKNYWRFRPQILEFKFEFEFEYLRFESSIFCHLVHIQPWQMYEFVHSVV